MPNVIQHKRSSTTADIPTTAQLSLGEIAVNTHDGKLFFKKDNGVETIVDISGNNNTDGGFANSTYIVAQLVDGGLASG